MDQADETSSRDVEKVTQAVLSLVNDGYDIDIKIGFRRGLGTRGQIILHGLTAEALLLATAKVTAPTPTEGSPDA